jgi:RNA polymerase sigma factor (sigma-70 family)
MRGVKSANVVINDYNSNDANNTNTSSNSSFTKKQSLSSFSSSSSSSSISSKTVSGALYQRAEMLEHTILTKEEEFTYGRQVVRAREVRERIKDFLEEKRVGRMMRSRMDRKEERLRRGEEEEEEEEDDEFMMMMMGRDSSRNSRRRRSDHDNDDDMLGDVFEEEEVVQSIVNGVRGKKTRKKFSSNNNSNDNDSNSELNEDFLSYELEYLSLYGFRPSIQDFENDFEGEGGDNNKERGAAASAAASTLGGFDLEDDLLIDHAQHRSHHMLQLRNSQSPLSFYGDVTIPPSSSSSPPSTTKRTGYRNSSASSTAASNSYTPLLHIPLHELSESDVITTLNIAGGRTELVNILLEGAYAREILMRRNVKLVTSIAKQWMRNSFSTANANLGSSSSTTTNNSGRSTRKYLSQMYEGSWDRPSLDEAVQEGMLGLARAVDKYDPERGLRFSTYATHWITSYVRVCFQRAVTGCLRVPSQLHDIKAAYQKIVKDHLVSGEEPPAQTVIAKTLGITPQRLSTAIRATGSLVSVDAPVISPGSGSYKGSAAGGDGGNSQELLILDTLKCAEPKPEDQVEISFLRQCLENAMASELTPYERDVLRLRLGLDSGTGKTVREIVEICGGGVTMSDVRSAERRAFKKLRSPTSVHTHNLLAYLDLAGADITFR